MKLERWSVVLRLGPYQAPEQGAPCLAGIVYGHPAHADGKLVRTSPIESADAEAETVTTHSGSVYELGEVDPDYEKIFRGARRRILAWGKNDEETNAD